MPRRSSKAVHFGQWWRTRSVHIFCHTTEMRQHQENTKEAIPVTHRALTSFFLLIIKRHRRKETCLAIEHIQISHQQFSTIHRFSVKASGLRPFKLFKSSRSSECLFGPQDRVRVIPAFGDKTESPGPWTLTYRRERRLPGTLKGRHGIVRWSANEMLFGWKDPRFSLSLLEENDLNYKIFTWRKRRRKKSSVLDGTDFAAIFLSRTGDLSGTMIKETLGGDLTRGRHFNLIYRAHYWKLQRSELTEG